MEGRERVSEVMFKRKRKVEKHFPSTFPGMGSQVGLTQKGPVLPLGTTDIITYHTAGCLFQTAVTQGNNPKWGERVKKKFMLSTQSVTSIYVAPEKELKTATDSPASPNAHLCQTAAPPLYRTLWHSLVQHCSWEILQGERGTNSIQSQRKRSRNKSKRWQLGRERKDRSRTETEKNKG